MKDLSISEVGEVLESNVKIRFSIKEIIVLDTMCSRISMNQDHDSEVMTLLRVIHHKVCDVLDLQEVMRSNMNNNLNKKDE